MTAQTLNVAMIVIAVIFAVEFAMALWVSWLSPRTRRIKREWRAAMRDNDR